MCKHAYTIRMLQKKKKIVIIICGVKLQYRITFLVGQTNGITTQEQFYRKV